MKKITLLVTLLAVSLVGFNQLQYAKVKIYANQTELTEISNLGVTIDHGHHKNGAWFITDLSELEIQILIDNGYTHEILIPDVASYYAAHINDANPEEDRVDCPESGGDLGYNPETPENFDLGAMGGYFTYEEYLAELDAMHAAYPDLITERAGIHDFETWEGRPITWVRISDNAEMDEDEEEVLYSAIHHAREPMSLSQTIFYMWYLLENYGTNDEVTYLVDHTEMYFVPMINPDGYKYNHTTNPGGGGMHRKNRNPSVGTSNKGVDLNRNYAYHWDESGTSPDENSDVYAGDGPFSEPETQAIKWFCENHNFKFAFNAHAFGDLLLYPIGWATLEFADDHDYFDDYTSHMAVNNGYAPQKATELYPAAGDSDDWMYADALDEKPEIFAVTPEVGDAFWPPSSAIVPTCKEMLFPNLIMAHLPHVFGVTEDLEASTIGAPTGYFNYEIQRLGLEDGDITITMTALAGIATISADANVHTLTIMETEMDSLSFELSAGIADGDEIKYVIHTDNGTWIKHDTITKTYSGGAGGEIEVFSDDGEDLSHWTGDWDFTGETYYSPSNCITDSPYDGTYGNNIEKEIVLNESFNLTGATYAYVNFRAKWEIETNYDYVMFMASTDDGDSWQPLCGNYTNTGVSDQGDGDGEPLYDGNQNSWVLEKVDLTDYFEESDVRFKFIIISDAFVSEDGFYFDDFTIFTDGYGISDVGINEFTEDVIQIFPNPANETLNITIAGNRALQTITIYDDLGQVVQQVNGNQNTFNVTGLAEGIYYIQLVDKTNTIVTKRFTVIH